MSFITLCIIILNFTIINAGIRFIIPEDTINFNELTKKSRYSTSFRRMQNEPNALLEDTIDNNIVTMSLFGGTELGYYYTTLFIGNPPQRQTLIVDTGSSISTFPCKDCGNNCGKNHYNSQFDPTISRSFSKSKCHESLGGYNCYECDLNNDNQCKFAIAYTEGSSLSGIYVKDQIRFGIEVEQIYASRSNQTQQDDQYLVGLLTINGSIGCTLRETKLFYTQEADGILGLGTNTNSLSAPPSFIDYFYSQHKNDNRLKFTLCYGESGGYMSVGGYNRTYHDTSNEVKYVKYTTPNNQYKLHLTKIQFGNLNLDINENDLNTGQGAFLDSGTTLFYAPRHTIEKMKKALDHFCSSKEGNCGGNHKKRDCYMRDIQKYPNLDDFFNTFLDFNFYFDYESVYSWGANGYLYKEYYDDKIYQKYCLSIQEFNDRTILGGVFMKHHDILFDKENSRIGFIKSNCEGFSRLSTEYYKGYQTIDLFSNRNYSNIVDKKDPSGSNDTTIHDKANSTNHTNPNDRQYTHENKTTHKGGNTNHTNTNPHNTNNVHNQSTTNQIENLPYDNQANTLETIISVLVILLIFFGLYCLLRVIRVRESLRQTNNQIKSETDQQMDYKNQELKTSNSMSINQHQLPRDKFSIVENEDGSNLDENYYEINQQNLETKVLQPPSITKSDDIFK